MIYEKALVIPKNTPISSPVSAFIEVHPGTVEQGSLFFPPGCCALAHVRIFYWEHQVWPMNPDSDFKGDGQLLVFPEKFELPGSPFIFRIDGWNEDDTYSHEPIVRILVTPMGETVGELLKRLTMGSSGPIVPVGGG
jgi:hypothetical protein